MGYQIMMTGSKFLTNIAIIREEVLPSSIMRPTCIMSGRSMSLDSICGLHKMLYLESSIEFVLLDTNRAEPMECHQHKICVS